jgi:ATP-dependent DNA ligase
VKVVSPAFVLPCVPKLATRPPTGAEWLHEAKHYGWRIQVIKDDDHVALCSRRGIDLADRFPALVEACSDIAARSCIIDGELVPADAGGFWTMPKATGRNGAGVCVVAFDLLHLDGRDLRALPLMDRKERLKDLLARSDVPCLVYADHFPDGSSQFTAAEKLGFEGVVSKRPDAPYRSGRCSSWVKVKSVRWLAMNRERWRVFARSRG